MIPKLTLSKYRKYLNVLSLSFVLFVRLNPKFNYLKTKLKLCAFLYVIFFSTHLYAVDRSQFYKVFSSESEQLVNDLLTQLEKDNSSSLLNAFKGALYMKQSSFLSKAKVKIETFKKGRILLENEIEAQPNNVEYRFLRLVIQEQAPSIVRYKSEIETDKQFVINNYSTLDHLLQKYISEYSKQSVALSKIDHSL